MMLIALIVGAVLGYTILGVMMSLFLSEILKWQDEDAIIASSIGWPIFIVFWMVAGTIIGIYILLKKMFKRLKNIGSKKTYTSEVK